MKGILLAALLLVGWANASAQAIEASPETRTLRKLLDDLGKRPMEAAEPKRPRETVSSEMPAGLEGKALVDFLVDRSDLAGEAGDSVRRINDLRQAAKHARSGQLYGRNKSYSRTRILLGLMNIEFQAGSPAEGIRISTELASEKFGPGTRFLALEKRIIFAADTGDLSSVRSLLDQNERVFSAARSSKNWADWQFNWTRHYELARAWGMSALGKPDDAEAAIRRAIDAAKAFAPLVRRLHEQGQSTAELSYYETSAIDSLEIDLSFFLLTQNKLAEAEYYARDALTKRLARSKAINATLRNPIQRLADVMRVGGRFTEAAELYGIALEVMERSGFAGDSTRSLVTRRTLGRALAALERWEDAVRVFAAVRRNVQTAGLPSGSYGSVVEGYAMLRAGDIRGAIRWLSGFDAWQRRHGLKETVEGAVVSGFLAEALARAGRGQEAAALYGNVIPALIDGVAGATEARLSADYLQQRRWIIEGYLEFVGNMESSDLAPDARRALRLNALRAANAVTGTGVQRAIQDAAIRASSGVSGLGDLARKSQDLRNEIEALYLALAKVAERAGASSSAGSDQEGPGSIRARIEAAGRELKEVDARIDREFPAYRDLLRPRVPSVAEVQARLKPGEASLVLYPAPNATYVWAIPREGEAQFRIVRKTRAEVEDDVRKLRRALDPNAFGMHAAIPEFDVGVAHGLYETIVKPFEGTLAGARHWIVVAHGALAQVPIALLPSAAVEVKPEAEVAFNQYKSVPWLLRKVAVTQVPSLSSLVTLRAQPAGRPERQSFAGFGDPVFSKADAARAKEGEVALRGVKLALRNYSRGLELDSSRLGQLPRLPDTADEIRGIARSLKADFDRDIFLGARANEREVKTRDLSNRKVIAFATHGLVPGELNGLTQPALALSAPEVAGVEGDGLLTLEEVLGLKLDADWVVLSACNTAAGEGAGAESITGLGRAFFYAGTRALLVSNWPVETVSARLLTTGIFERQAADPRLTRAEALRQSMLHLIDNGVANDAEGKPAYSYSHPLFWAPFTLIGDGG